MLFKISVVIYTIFEEENLIFYKFRNLFKIHSKISDSVVISIPIFCSGTLSAEELKCCDVQQRTMLSFFGYHQIMINHPHVDICNCIIRAFFNLPSQHIETTNNPLNKNYFKIWLDCVVHRIIQLNVCIKF